MKHRVISSIAAPRFCSCANTRNCEKSGQYNRKLMLFGKKTREDKTNSESYNIKKIWLNLNHSTASMAVFFIYMCVCAHCVRCVLCPDGLNFTHKSTVYSNFQQFFFSLYAQRKSHNNTSDAVEK